MSDFLKEYQRKLLDAGFQEASLNPLHFYKKASNNTEFIINLKDLKDYIGVVYGIKSTASLLTEKDWEYHAMMGISDDNCNLRYYLEISSDDEANKAEITIQDKFYEYINVDKDTLLKVVKELRKGFMAKINDVLKPLGFKKKGNQWRKNINEDFLIQIHADKAPYSDLYYFDFCIYSMSSTRKLACYFKDFEMLGTNIFDWKKYPNLEFKFDWQLQSTTALQTLIKNAYENEISQFLDYDIYELGTKEWVWERCICPRDCCENCWIEKNLWEAKKV